MTGVKIVKIPKQLFLEAKRLDINIESACAEYLKALRESFS
jgi:transcriptional regulator